MSSERTKNLFGNKKVYDFSNLNDLSEGDVEFEISVINYFIENTPTYINQLKSYYKEKNWGALRETAHKLKPQFKFMGVSKASKEIEIIENLAAYRLDIEDIPSLIEYVDSISKIAVEQLSVELKKRQKTKK